MTGIILPASWYSRVLDDPFGLEAITTDKPYSGAGRFTSHWTLSKYYKTAPLWLQNFMSPIQSVYTAGGLARIFTQLLIAFLLAYLITGRVWSKGFVIVLAIIVPLFQAGGKLYIDMAIVDGSVTYTFFYGLPLAFLLLYYTPLFYSLIHNRPLKIAFWQVPFLFVLAIALAFSSPLIQPVVLLGTAIFFVVMWWNAFRQANGSFLHRTVVAVIHISWQYWIYLGLFSVLCLYAYFVGTHNAENTSNELFSLGERYGKMFLGIGKMFTRPFAYPFLLVVLGINIWLLKRRDAFKESGIRQVVNVLAIFCVAYLLLLPMGGYRAYRPYVIRYDTLIPVTLSLIFLFGLTTFHLIKLYSKPAKSYYAFWILVVCGVYTLIDAPNYDDYYCERNALRELAASTEYTVELNYNCSVMSWSPISEPGRTNLNAQLLQYWNIIDKDKRYYQPE